VSATLTAPGEATPPTPLAEGGAASSAVRPEGSSKPRVSRELRAAERLLSAGRPAAALEQFQREIARRPHSTRALRGACSALGQLHRVNEAARVCRHALSLDPSDVGTHACLASIYYSGAAYQWAANEWLRVLRLRPADAQAKRGLRMALAHL
jgi:cytochrome c-type biogenesis protein CcmH/NrfG